MNQSTADQLEARTRTRRNLRAWMKGHISNQELAQKLEVSPVYISYLRTSDRNISDSFLWRFTSHFGVEAAREVFGEQLDEKAETRYSLHAWIEGRITNQQLADILQVSPSYIASIQSQRKNPSGLFLWEFVSRYGPQAAREVFGEQLDARTQNCRKNLRAWMKGRISNQELADELQISQSYASHILTGKRVISDAVLWKFVSRYGPDAAAQVFGLPHGDTPAADGETNGNGASGHLAQQREPVLA